MTKVLLLNFLLVLPALSFANTQNQDIYDGRWWQSSSADKRQGFVSGYLDCYIWDVKGKQIPGGSIKQIADRVTRQLSPNETVAHILSGTLATEANMINGQPHGDYDGGG